ncbi:nucleotide exchange factor GrpE [Candidatus Gracilibacteria bacterium]|nr:nucleotide exchange factor GrpE [Candidatus Gracilibacteria bacterium]
MTKKEEENKENEFETLEQELESELENIEEEEKELEGDISKISTEINILKDSLARAQADYHNLVKRVERDKADMGSYITGNVVVRLLTFVDNLERLISATPEDQKQTPLFEGIKSTHSGIIKTLETMGVKSFDSLLQEVDTDLHEVMSQLPGKEGIIIQEFEKGYKLHDKVIRHAKVIVGTGE